MIDTNKRFNPTYKRIYTTMKKIILILLILFCFEGISQTGGRKLEKTNTVRRWRLFKKNPKTSPWIYRKTKPGIIQERELPKLFKRKRTNGEKENEKVIKRQNKLRTKRRVRGNEVFHKRKYF